MDDSEHLSPTAINVDAGVRTVLSQKPGRHHFLQSRWNRPMLAKTTISCRTHETPDRAQNSKHFLGIGEPHLGAQLPVSRIYGKFEVTVAENPVLGEYGRVMIHQGISLSFVN